MNSQKIISLNPGKNYEKIGEVSISSHEEINAKVAKARKAQPAWYALGIKERIALLDKVYDAFKKNEQQIISLIAQEVGIPVSICKKVDFDAGLLFMRGYLDNAQEWLAPQVTFENNNEIHYLFFEAKGVAGCSIPWNYPFSNFIWAVMQSLIVGNTVVCKHSEECPLTAQMLEKIIASTGLPDGVFNQIYGTGQDAGEYLMNSAIDILWFTGSTGVGKHLYQVAAKNFIPAILELGGSAPGIIFEDADVRTTIESVYYYRFVNSGQTCDALKRLIVHVSLFDTVVDSLQKILATKKMGDPSDPATDLGPVAAERQLISLEQQVHDAIAKGAKVIYGGKRPQGLQGAYYEPTVLTNITFDMKVWKEEVFGPVLPIVTFETEEEAIALANDSIYGLGGYIYTQDMQRALRVSSRLQTGNISVNDTSYVIPQDPFGGYKLSGLGREHGKQGLRELCQAKLVALKKALED